LEIFGFSLKPGERLYNYVSIGELACFSEIKFPFLAIRGGDAPVLWLTGAVHGDELNGLWAMRRLFWELDPHKLRGTLIVTPLLNPMAFLAHNKISNLDYLDMDQQFPGNPAGLYSERMASVIFSEMKRLANYVIDFHTMNHDSRAVPYTVSKIVPGASTETVKKAYGMARIFGVYPNCRLDLSKSTSELPGTTSGSIDITCMKNNIPCFMAELGGGGRWDEEIINIARQGIINVMTYLELLDGKPQYPSKQLLISNRCFLRCNHGGLARMAVEPGNFIKKGDLLATIYNFWEEVDHLYAQRDHFIIGACFQPVVSTGDRIAFVGNEWHESDWRSDGLE
jgi:predicted deacylase